MRGAGSPGRIILGGNQDVVVPDQRVQEAGPEERGKELLSVHQDTVSLRHHPLYADLHFPAHMAVTETSDGVE